MAKAAALFASFWTDRDMRNLSKEEKLIFLFLISHNAPSGGAVSGIFEIEPRDIAYWLGVGADKVGASLKRGIKNIIYDSESGVVFVRNKIRYGLGGAPELNSRSILSDYKITSKAEDIWKEFVQHNGLFIQRAVTVKGMPRFDLVMLADLLKLDKAELSMEEITPMPKKKKKTVSERVVNKRVGELINSIFTACDKDKETRDLFSEVWRYLTTNLMSSEPLTLVKRLDILERMEKVHPLIIARAAYEFKKKRFMDTGKRDNFFFGIVRNSASSWYLEERNRRDKKKFKLGDM